MIAMINPNCPFPFSLMTILMLSSLSHIHMPTNNAKTSYLHFKTNLLIIDQSIFITKSFVTLKAREMSVSLQ